LIGLKEWGREELCDGKRDQRQIKSSLLVPERLLIEATEFLKLGKDQNGTFSNYLTPSEFLTFIKIHLFILQSSIIKVNAADVLGDEKSSCPAHLVDRCRKFKGKCTSFSNCKEKIKNSLRVTRNSK